LKKSYIFFKFNLVERGGDLKKKTLFFILALFLFLLLIVIAVFLKNFPFVRGFLGDTLAVVFLYFLAKSFYDFHPFKLSFAVFFSAFLIEMSQYFHLADLIGIPKSSIFRIVIGSVFDPLDILAYFTGALISIWIEKKFFLKRGKI